MKITQCTLNNFSYRNICQIIFTVKDVGWISYSDFRKHNFADTKHSFGNGQYINHQDPGL